MFYLLTIYMGVEGLLGEFIINKILPGDLVDFLSLFFPGFEKKERRKDEVIQTR